MPAMVRIARACSALGLLLMATAAAAQGYSVVSSSSPSPAPSAPTTDGASRPQRQRQAERNRGPWDYGGLAPWERCTRPGALAPKTPCCSGRTSHRRVARFPDDPGRLKTLRRDDGGRHRDERARPRTAGVSPAQCHRAREKQPAATGNARVRDTDRAGISSPAWPGRRPRRHASRGFRTADDAADECQRTLLSLRRLCALDVAPRRRCERLTTDRAFTRSRGDTACQCGPERRRRTTARYDAVDLAAGARPANERDVPLGDNSL